MDITTSAAAEITLHHDLARTKATEAISHAMGASLRCRWSVPVLSPGTWHVLPVCYPFAMLVPAPAGQRTTGVHHEWRHPEPED